LVGLTIPLRLSPPPLPALFPYTTLFRSGRRPGHAQRLEQALPEGVAQQCWLPRRQPHLRLVEAVEGCGIGLAPGMAPELVAHDRSEEHTSELQSRSELVCRLLLERKIFP